MWSKITSYFTKVVNQEDLKYIVPYESNDGFVGVDFIRQLAKEKNGIFSRDTKGIGLMDSFSVLKSELFDPELVHPTIHDFYENTINYRIDVIPKWRWYFLPAYWLLRKIVFERIGNANLPFDKIEASQGITSHIDTIDFEN